MKKLIIGLLLVPFLNTGCPPRNCHQYEGYGRYTLKVNCESVKIDGVRYKLTFATAQNDFVIAGHTIARGIMRKTRPWLYIHSINVLGRSVDVTFDNGSKPEYPLYTGSSGSIFDVYSKPWDIKKSTCISFPEKNWLVSHRWGNNGIYFDLQSNIGSDQEWKLIEEIFVGVGNEVTVESIHTKISIINYNASEETATVKFSAL
jgi:hypothetical protein